MARDMTSPVSSAAFPARLVALGLDVVVLAMALVVVVYGANTVLRALAGPMFTPFWESPSPLNIVVEPAGATREVEEGGRIREIVFRRETRFFRDGAVRIYAITDGRVTSADGRSSSTHYEAVIGETQSTRTSEHLTLALAIVLPFFYFALMESSRHQGSLGKIALGLKVTDLAGERLGLGRSLFRQTMKMAEVASSGITYLIAGFTGRRQALHDMFAGTLVVRQSRAPALAVCA